jgi:DNA-binding CsgD family transcriptional regulator
VTVKVNAVGRDERDQLTGLLTMSLPSSPELSDVYRGIIEGRFGVFARQSVELGHAWDDFTKIGFESFLWVISPLDDNTFSSVSFFRRRGRESFTMREKKIAQLLFEDMEWLHRNESAVSLEVSRRVPELPPRQKQVLHYLLQGDSLKEIANKLEISPHTVGDYVKKIYKAFNVNSRSELLATFVVK